MASRNTGVLTPDEFLPTELPARPAGLRALIPVRFMRDLAGKVRNNFSVLSNGASFFRPKVGVAFDDIDFSYWSKMFEPEKFGGSFNLGGGPLLGTDNGELSDAEYVKVGASGGTYARATGNIIEDALISDNVNDLTPVYPLDTALSRDGKLQYNLFRVRAAGPVDKIIFTVIDVSTGTEIDRFVAAAAAGVISGTATGNIAVVDDTSGQESPTLTYDDAFIAFAFRDFADSFGYYFLMHYDSSAHTLTAFGSPPAPVLGHINPYALCVVANSSAGGTALDIYYVYGQGTGATTINALVFDSAGTPAAAAIQPFGGGGLQRDTPEIVPAICARRRNPTDAANREQNLFIVTVQRPAAVDKFFWEIIDRSGAEVALSSNNITFPGNARVQRFKADPFASTEPTSAVGTISGKDLNIGIAYTTFDPFSGDTVVGIVVTSARGAATNSNYNHAIVTQVATGKYGRFGMASLIEEAGGGGTFVGRFAMTFRDPTTGIQTYVEVGVSSGAVFTDLGTSGNNTSTAQNANLNGLTVDEVHAPFAMSRWNDVAAAHATSFNELQAINYSIAGQDFLNTRVVAPRAGLMIDWNAREYARLVNPTAALTNPRRVSVRFRGQGFDSTGFIQGARLSTLRNVAGVPDYTLGLTLNSTKSSETPDAFVTETADTSVPADADDETFQPVLWPTTGVPGSTATFTATPTGVPQDTMSTVVWTTGGTPNNRRVKIGHVLEITAPVAAAGKYRLVSFSIDGSNNITGMVFDPPLPTPIASVPTLFTARIAGSASKSIMQILTPNAVLSDMRDGNVIFPSIVEIDYVSLQSLHTNPEIADMDVPFQNAITPGYASVAVKVVGASLLPTGATGVKAKLSLDAGATFKTKQILNVATITGPSGVGTFGVQAYKDTGWVPAVSPFSDIQVGDYLNVLGGPNKGIYVITGFSSAPAPMSIFLDRPFPSPGDPTTAYEILPARIADMGGDIKTYFLQFDLDGLPVVGSDVRIEVEASDTGANVSFEVDDINIQWAP